MLGPWDGSMKGSALSRGVPLSRARANSLDRERRLNRLITDQTLREQLVEIPVIRVDSHVELERLDDRLTGIDGQCHRV